MVRIGRFCSLLDKSEGVCENLRAIVSLNLTVLNSDKNGSKGIMTKFNTYILDQIVVPSINYFYQGLSSTTFNGNLPINRY